MSDELLKRLETGHDKECAMSYGMHEHCCDCSYPARQEAAARVRELEEKLRIRQRASEIVGTMAMQQKERAERAELELKTGVEALTESLLNVTNERDALRLEMQAACTSLCPHGLDIAAQKENAERKLREYEHMVMTGRNEQHERLVAERDALRADNERLRAALIEALSALNSNEDTCIEFADLRGRIAALAGEKPC